MLLPIHISLKGKIGCGMRFFVLNVIILFLASAAHAQGVGFAVSGQGRGSQADAKQGAQIDQLYSRDQTQQSELNDHEARISNNETEIGQLEPHADQPTPNCSTSQKLQWTGSIWRCVNEQDPTVGIHAQTGEPPDCNDSTAKLLWNASANRWECKADRNDGSGGGYGAGFETDPQVGSLVNGRLCRSNGSQVICDGNMSRAGIPVCNATTQKLRWNGSRWSCHTDRQGVTSERDPQVGSLRNGKWCRASSGQVRCTYDKPSGSTTTTTSGGGCVPNTGYVCRCSQCGSCNKGIVACNGSCQGCSWSGCCRDRGDW